MTLNSYLVCILAAAIAYLIGNFSSAFVFSKLFAHEDVRTKGSGNAGAANMLRNYGVKMGIGTFLFDLLKGSIAALIGRWIGGDMGMYWAAIAVLAGHNWPALLNFKGGKGVSTSIGVLFVVNWQATLIIFVIAVSLMLITGYVSLASVFGLAVCPFVIAIMYWGNWPLIITICIISIIVIISHRKNLVRLVKGEETKLSFRRGGERGKRNLK